MNLTESPSLIQRDTARNGEAIFKIDGRSLVSSFDPSKEAQAWTVKSLQETGAHEAVLVIGAACGYHLKALKSLRPSLSVLTVEASEEVKNFVLETHKDISSGEILVAPSAMDLTTSAPLRDFLSGRFAVLVHPGQAQMRAEWTDSISKFLTARDPLSFLMQLRMRPELHALFDEEQIAKLAYHEGPISILTIRKLFKPETKTSRERRIWRVLEELIV